MVSINQEELIINQVSVALQGARTLQISQRTEPTEWLVRWSRVKGSDMEFGTHVAIFRGGEVALFWGDYCGFGDHGNLASIGSFKRRKEA